MNLYAITDIGSNTMVLIIYKIEQNIPVVIKHISTAVKLIDYVDNKKYMQEKGIQTAIKVLNEYTKVASDYHCIKKMAFITEPARIINQVALVHALSSSGFSIDPLSGSEEAIYDFYGSQLSYPNSANGIAFDVGGGSTELISFSKHKVIEAISFPLGCVRLSHLPLNTDACSKEIINVMNLYPSLNQSSDILIGIGGTCNAAALLADKIYHCGNQVDVQHLEEIFIKIIQKDTFYINAFESYVAKSRQDVFLPGLHMILEIARLFHASTIKVSKTGIREGYLLHHI